MTLKFNNKKFDEEFQNNNADQVDIPFANTTYYLCGHINHPQERGKLVGMTIGDKWVWIHKDFKK